MRITKPELITRLAAINNGFNMSAQVVLIQDKTGEVTWPEMPFDINLMSIRINFNTQEIKCTFSPLKPAVKLETIFRECYEQGGSCCGCRWFNTKSKKCVFQGKALDDWPEVIEDCGYELEDKLW